LSPKLIADVSRRLKSISGRTSFTSSFLKGTVVHGVLRVVSGKEALSLNGEKRKIVGEHVSRDQHQKKPGFGITAIEACGLVREKS